MWTTVLILFEAVLGMAFALGLFYVLQMYIRYKSGCGKDRDLLEFMAHGCAGCKGPGTCHSDPAKEHHHEAV